MLRTGLKLLTGRSSDAHRELLPENLLAAVTEKFTALFDAGRDVKNCATTMGLFHERNVAQGAANADNLKALLLKLDGALERLSTTKPTEVRELAQWVKMAVERIDVCQLMNVVSRQRDGLLYLPIPFLFQNEVRVGDFFSRLRKTTLGKECTAWVFVDFPELGPVMVELRLVGKRLSSLVRCGSETTRDYLAEKMMSLKERLYEAGYEVLALGCVVERELERRRQELWEDIPAYHDGALQVSV